MENQINRLIEITKKISPKSFVNENNELIVVPKNNIWFLLDDIDDEMDFKCRIFAWLSRPSCKGISDYWQKRVLQIVNELLEANFTKEEIGEIYTYLGNDCNRPLCMKFIESGYDLNLLNKKGA